MKRVFYQEAFILNNVDHQNILKLIGVSFGHTVNIAFEDISRRKNLLTYLRNSIVETDEEVGLYLGYIMFILVKFLVISGLI